MSRILILLFTLLSLCLVPAWAKILQIGDTVPNFTLLDQNGQETSLEQFRGQGVVLTFLYTECPFPNKCQMIAKKLTSLARLMDKIGSGDKVQLLAVTLDPARDKPEVLKAYAQGYDKDRSNWRFLTGSEKEIAQVAGGFGVLYWDDKGVIEHNMRTFYIDPQGVIQVVKSGSDWRPGEFAAEIGQLMKTKP